jgi:AraC family transcriptional regulator of adaptative response/methylated-DNA-[protein]-cysteine methyltransferase
MSIGYTTVDSPLGRLLVAGTGRGICAVSFGDGDEELTAALSAEFPAAGINRDDRHLKEWVESLLNHLEGRQPGLNLPLDVRATAFQWKVYEELLKIPYGDTRSYGEIAEALGEPRAVRAVAGACAKNPAAVVIPCHRAIRKDGGLAGYRWGIERKRELLGREKSLSGLLAHREEMMKKSSTKTDEET